MKRLAALLLCLALVVSLIGCGKAPATGDTQTTTEPDATTLPVPDAAAIYADAAETLGQREDMKLNVIWAQTTVLGEDVFKETIQQEIDLRGVGTDAFAASLEETCYNGSYYTGTEEIFADGMLYFSINYQDFRAEITAEDYFEGLVPAVLLDESLYTVEQSTRREYVFTGATEPEAWLDNPYMDFISGEGTAEIDTDGKLVRSTYKAVYSQGAARVELSVTVRVSETDGSPIQAPEKGESYSLLDTPDAPMMIHAVTGYLLQANARESTIVEVNTVTAAAYMDASTVTMQTFGAEQDIAMKYVQSYQALDLSSGELLYDVTWDDTYVDGIMTSVTDGGDPVTDAGYSASTINNYAESTVLTGIPDISMVEDFDLTVLGDVAILEYTWKDGTCEDVIGAALDEILADPEGYLAAADSFTVDEACGSISLDASTLMPMGMSMSFSGTHVIDGQAYQTQVSIQQLVRLGSAESFAAITGESLPEEEPETLPTPLFYHVTGTGGQEMWLLGTIHVGDVRTKYLPREIYDAFDGADALALEFESGEFMEQAESDEALMQAIAEAYLYTDGTTLKDHIAPELYEDAIRLLKATGNYQISSGAYKPYFIAQSLDNYFLDYGYLLSSGYGVDSLLEDRANEQNKEILSVESGLSQIQMLAGFSDRLQELLLEQTVYYGHVGSNMASAELFEMWCRGDEAALIDYINSDDSDELTEEEKLLLEEYNKAVSTDRNVRMAEVAMGYLESGDTVFYAVGLAHLLAEDGLVNALREAGYTVELVPYS